MHPLELLLRDELRDSDAKTIVLQSILDERRKVRQSKREDTLQQIEI
jgi:hypothetical protein